MHLTKADRKYTLVFLMGYMKGFFVVFFNAYSCIFLQVSLGMRYCSVSAMYDLHCIFVWQRTVSFQLAWLILAVLAQTKL